MLIESLHKFHAYYGPNHRIPFPTGSDTKMNLDEIATEIATRLKRLFLKDADGRRAMLGDSALEQSDPLFAGLLPFPEYFHGDTGRGLGAMHQTGWTALVAILLHPRDGLMRRMSVAMPPAVDGEADEL
jgi:hypothetical protein